MSNEDNNTLIATFSLGDTSWGLDSLEVHGVIRVSEITKVHNAQEYIIGIVNLRGKIVTVIDLNKKLGLPVNEISNLNRIILVEWKGESIGLFVDSVSDVIDIDNDLLTSAPPTLYGARDGYIESVYKTDKQLIAILNLNAVLEILD